MGGTISKLNLNNDKSITLRLMSYNVEWGFLNLPSDINSDSCGHSIPNTSEAQKEHLNLISKNIGFLSPDICFLQEMGSLQAMKYISDHLFMFFGLKYKYYYSNGDEQGNQGVGLLIEESSGDELFIFTDTGLFEFKSQNKNRVKTKIKF